MGPSIKSGEASNRKSNCLPIENKNGSKKAKYEFIGMASD
jgi:hypothetical protein